MVRLRYQKGCVFLRGRVWVLRFREDVMEADGTLGRRHRSIVLGPFLKKKEALREAEKHLRPFNQGAFRPQAAITFEEFWHRYFMPEMLPTLKFSTRKLYTSLTNKHLLPYFGEQKLSEIQRLEVQHFVTEKQQLGYSVQTLAHLRDLLSKILGTARSWGWLQDNVARGVKLPPMERVREARVLTVEEITKLSRVLGEPVRTMFLLAVGLGLRIGEVLPLRLEDVDLLGGILCVRRDFYRGHIQTPKTTRSERRFALPQPLLTLLGAYLNRRKSESDLMFPSSAGTILDDRNLIRREVEPACKRLGIARFSWHALRHTFATVAGDNRVSLPVLQSLLGHTSPTMTLHYTHPQDDSKRSGLETVAGVLFLNVPDLWQGSLNSSSGEKLIQ